MAHLTRRNVLASGTALAAVATLPRRGTAQTMPVLRAAPGTAQLAPAGYPATSVWAYAANGVGTIPGPEIRVMAGDTMTRRLINDLPQPTAVHWHGIRIANAMDGAAPLTQAPVPPGESFDYSFTAPDPGTYWYHAHNRGFEQVARGLAGPLIVEDRTPWLGEPGAATREVTVVLDDWLLDAQAAIIEDRWDDLHSAAHAGRMGNTVTVNGAAYPDLPMIPGERVRLRLINTATARILPLSFQNLTAHLIALDGHPVTPRPVSQVLLGPAQRADVVVDAGALRGALLIDAGQGDPVEVAALPVVGAPAEPSTAAVRPLPAWGTWPSPDLNDPRKVDLVMEGGAMRGMASATYQGEVMDFQTLTENGMVWTFNGIAHAMDSPLFDVATGRTVQMTLANRTMFAHAIHTHGHHFQVLKQDGAADPFNDVRDTVLVGPDSEVTIAFVADNPGDWMIHCHMLSHQATGMMAWFRVT